MIQAGFRFNSSVFGMGYTIPCNQWKCSSLLFCDIDRPLLYTSGKCYKEYMYEFPQWMFNLDSDCNVPFHTLDFCKQYVCSIDGFLCESERSSSWWHLHDITQYFMQSRWKLACHSRALVCRSLNI